MQFVFAGLAAMMGSQAGAAVTFSGVLIPENNTAYFLDEKHSQQSTLPRSTVLRSTYQSE